MFVQNINPDLISIGPFVIRFYGIVYVLGFLAITQILASQAEKGKIKNLNKERAVDLMTYGMLSIIVGARIGHVLFEFRDYVRDPIAVFKVWNGGLAFFGGLAGAVLFMYYYTKKHWLSFFRIADVIVVPLPFFIGLGRIANFINAEHYGTPTGLPWGVVFTFLHDNIPRHPAQLYEAVSMFALFAVMLYLARKEKKTGFLFWSFIAVYSLLRFITEFFRAPGHYIFGLSLAQYLSVGTLMLGWYYLKRLS